MVEIPKLPLIISKIKSKKEQTFEVFTLFTSSFSEEFSWVIHLLHSNTLIM
jgi:hypothetical protein